MNAAPADDTTTSARTHEQRAAKVLIRGRQGACSALIALQRSQGSWRLQLTLKAQVAQLILCEPRSRLGMIG